METAVISIVGALILLMLGWIKFDINRLDARIDRLSERVDLLSERVARIEGRLDGRDAERNPQ